MPRKEITIINSVCLFRSSLNLDDSSTQQRRIEVKADRMPKRIKFESSQTRDSQVATRVSGFTLEAQNWNLDHL